LIFYRSERLIDAFCISVPNFVKIGQTVAEKSRFCDFQDGGCRHLGFSKNRNFNGRASVKCSSMRHLAKIRQRFVEIWQFNSF